MPAIRTGLDITPGVITAAQVRVSRAGWSLLRHATMARRAGGEVLSHQEAIELESVLFRRGFAPAPCVIGAPEGALKTATLELPPVSSGAPIDQLARSEFARRTKLDAESFELSYWSLPTPGPAVQVMAVGCLMAATDAVIDSLELAGLRVAGVDDPSRALGRVLAAAPTAATVRVGARLDPWGSHIIVLHDSTLLYARTPSGLRLGGEHADAEVARRLSTEIDACISFARHRCRSHAPASISVLGFGATNQTVLEVLGHKFSNAMTRPLDRAGQEIDGTLAAAIGLALLEDLA
ncbi:MAG: hypothetical protein ACIAS6_06100 [Phycisphaerales bacterium JB060]